MALTSEQRADLQADLGLSSDQTVFTDAELDRLYTRAEENYAAAVYLGWQQILANTTKFFNYTAGQTSIQRSQVFDHVRAMVQHWGDQVDKQGGNQLRVVGANPIPPRHKETPDTYRRRRSFGPRRD